MENKIKKINDSQLVNLESQLNLIISGQKQNSGKIDIVAEELRRGFIGLALRNEELLELNKKLTQQLEIVVGELNEFKRERQEKAARKEARSNRKRLPKRDAMTSDIYTELIKASEGTDYLKIRLRLAICILTVTGIRINELLPLKVHQLETLVQEYWVGIDRSKGGSINHKSFLTNEGKQLIQDRKKDFEFILLIKEPDAYVFTSETNHYQKLRREAITKDVNKVMRSVSRKLPGQPNLTSHSCRIGYITQLWKDSKDIEFVKQTIGHQRLDTTSAYVNRLSDQEIRKRLEEL